MSGRSGLLWIAFALTQASLVSADDDWPSDWDKTVAAATDDPTKPILVKFEASWCGPCRMLTEALKNPEAIHLIEAMHPVKIDVDNPPENAPGDDVSALPTMRIMTVSGDILGEHVGLLEGEPLMEWLRDGQEKFKSKRAALRLVKQLANGQLNEEQTGVLIEMLADRSPRQRAAASGLLIAHPRKVAGSVVATFEKPKLRTRLAALDVLHRWTAPVDGLDPWQPETITEARIQDLKDWSASFVDDSDLHAKLQRDAEQEAELELDRLVRRGDVRSGIVESLGLLGEDLRPSVKRRLGTETADTARERLSSVLYRLVAAPTLAIRLPNAADQLASLDADPRRQAAQSLSEQAKKEDIPLLETLFGHSDPLVRELALRGLQKAGGGDTMRLTKLLDDPDKNVRAAVLKLWLDNPNSSLIGPVSEHAMTETDSGLLVYYVRLLKEISSSKESSHLALKRLAANDDWQVRAEVAEAISHRVTESSSSASIAFPPPLREAARLLLDDDDSFVLSKIVPAILKHDQQKSFSKLLDVAWKHPDIRNEIIPKLTNTTGKKDSAKFLVARLRSDSPKDRVFAIEAMSRFKTDGYEESIRQGFDDESIDVQVAATKALTTWLDTYHRRLKELPPAPPEEDPFAGVMEFSGELGELEFLEVDAEPMGSPGGFLNAFGAIFGGVPAQESAEEVTAIIEPTLQSSRARLDRSGVAAPLAEPPPINVVPQEVLSGEPLSDEPDSSVPDEPSSAPDVPGVTPPEPGDVPDESEEPTWTPAVLAQAEKAIVYDQWLERWRNGPEEFVPWLTGVRERVEVLSKLGGESETHALMLLLRLGGDAESNHILEVAGRLPKPGSRLAAVYAWLERKSRQSLFEAAGKLEDSATVLPLLLNEARQFDPKKAATTYWKALQKMDTSALHDAYELRGKLMLMTSGSEYPSFADPETLQPIIGRLQEQVKESTGSVARLIALSVLSELDASSVSELVGDDYTDTALDPPLRRDWARMALASRDKKAATELSVEMLDDQVLLPVALTFMTEGYEGIETTELGEMEIIAVDSGEYSSGRLTVPTISPLIDKQRFRELLQHEDRKIVARATYALAVLGEKMDVELLLKEARAEGLSPYMDGLTNLAVLAIAACDRDDQVAFLQEIYESIDPGNNYYIKDLYWKIRIMTGPNALALRKRIRDEVGMNSLT